MIIADSRWQGPNGIGRYAREVLSRVTVPFAPMPPGGSPSSPIDFLKKKLSVRGVKPAGVYSPGYNGFLRNVPQTITVHDLIYIRGPHSAKYRPYFDLFLKPLIKRNGHLITVSEASKVDIQNWLATDAVEVINAGMGASASFVLEGRVHEAERPYFLYVGNLRPHKNVDTLMRAMRSVPDCDLYVVSSDSVGAKAMAQSHGIAQRVQIYSNTTDHRLATLYRGARATVQPSIIEGFGLPALESALCGTPVIFYKGCASVEEICAGYGLPVESPDDPAQWADMLNSVEIGSTFPSDVANSWSYSWESVAREVDSIIARFHSGMYS